MSPTRRVALVFLTIQTIGCSLFRSDPYPPPDRAATDLARAEARARDSGKILMVIFGGNWCPDCRMLHQRLHESPVREYADKRFEIVGINIGEKDANLDIASRLGVNLDKGVPVAAFIRPDGTPLGNTNQGQLEPARGYSAGQVLTFLRNVAEKRVIEKPK